MKTSARRDPGLSFETLAEAMPQLVWTAASDGRIEYSNRRMSSYLGFDPFEIPTPALFERAVHREDLERAQELWRIARDTRSPYEHRARFRRVDGTYRWHLSRAVPVFDSAEAIMAWVGTSTDIDEEVRIERDRLRAFTEAERLREEAEASRARATRLQAVAAALSRALTQREVGEVLIRDTMRALGAFSGAVSLIDASRTTLVRIATAGLSHPDVLKATDRMPLDARSPITDAARTGELVWLSSRQESRARYPKLEWMTVQLDIHAWGALPLVFEDRIIGALGIACAFERQISSEDRALLGSIARQCAQALERARLYHEAESASRAKDEFMAVLGHELRNPLSPILTALELMRIRGDESSARERSIIERQLKHVVRLVDDLLDVSRITRKMIELKREYIELFPIVARSIEMASPVLEQRLHVLDVEVPREGLLVEADPVRLAQVVANLLTNAAKYTAPGGRVRVQAEREHGEVVIRVRDNGDGIASEMLPHIFTMFVQADRRLERAQGGLGLGLTIVRSLVELHGGTVRAASEGIGKGSEFMVRLPAIGDKHVQSGDSIQKRTPDAPAERRILIVDDNQDAADMLADLLQATGYAVCVAYDAPSALDLADRFQPEFAFLDVGLPVMDGYELGRRLRERPGLSALTLVAVTGYGQESDRERSAAAGFRAHIVKPIDLASLESLLRG
jgi:PAS domain S-box-containing protein